MIKEEVIKNIVPGASSLRSSLKPLGFNMDIRHGKTPVFPTPFPAPGNS